MNRALRVFLLAAVLLAPLGCGAGTADGSPYPALDGWASRPLFNDGRAEVCTYRATLTREGAPRETRVRTVLVAEDLDPDLLVKADDWKRPGLLRCLKFGTLASIQTGIMAYHEAAYVFVAAADWIPVKEVRSHQDWCGTTLKSLVNRGGRHTFRWTTYWERDGGSGERELPIGDRTVPADALPAWIRGLDLKDGLAFDLEILPSFEGSKAGHPEPEKATLRVAGPTPRTVPAGTFTCWTVTVESGGRTFEASVQTGFPNLLVAWTDFHGQPHELESSQRTAYWEKTAPGDESLLEP